MGKSAQLQRLSDDVEAMRSVFSDVNKAREDSRRGMDELHLDLVRRIGDTKELLGQEVKRLDATIASFKSKFEHELRTMRETLMTKLNTRVSNLRAAIAKLDSKIDGCRHDLKQEITDRENHVESVLAPIQKDVAQLVVELKEERACRLNKEADYRKNLADAIEALEKNLDVEKFNREQQFQDLRVLGEYERERILKRQYAMEYAVKKSVDVIDVNIQHETSTRLGTQDGIVSNLTSFIDAFKTNITEEGKMG